MQATLNCEPSTQLNPDEFALEFRSRFGSPVRYYDDGMGSLWIMRDSMGIVGIIRAHSWEDAYSIVEDEFLPVVSAEELHEAYDMTAEEFHKLTHAERNETGNWPDLAEGFSYQSNSTGTGIVSHDLNGESLDPLTPALAAHLEIEIIVKLSK
jgi:hypothetical protein